MTSWFTLLFSIWFGASLALGQESPPLIPDPYAPLLVSARRANAVNRNRLCLKLNSSLGSNYRALYDFHHDGNPLSQKLPAYSIAFAGAPDCQTAKQVETLKHYAAVLQEHSGKIGLLVSGGEGFAPRAKAMQQGIEGAFTEFKKDFATLAVVLKTDASAKSAQEKLGELVFNHDVALVLALVTPGEAAALLPWADKLDLPILFLSHEDSAVAKTRFAFSVFPSEKKLGEALAESAKSRGFTRLGVLRPVSKRADRLIAAMISSAQEIGIEVTEDASYEAGNFKSMDAAVRQVFNIDPKARADEYRLMIRKEKEKSRIAKTRFNPRQVILKPQIEIDALFIPDDFRMVRHFVKLLQYNGVKKLPLFGNFEWRSDGLIDPPEPYLHDSWFVDFIGGYDQLPLPLKIADLESPLFAEAEQVKTLDFSLIGYRSACIAIQAVTNQTIRRWKIPTALEALKTTAAGFFSSGPAFATDHASTWPAFVFTISEE